MAEALRGMEEHEFDRLRIGDLVVEVSSGRIGRVTMVKNIGVEVEWDDAEHPVTFPRMLCARLARKGKL